MLRNLGVGIGYAPIAYQSTLKNVSKLELNQIVCWTNWIITGAGWSLIQTNRSCRYGIEKAVREAERADPR